MRMLRLSEAFLTNGDFLESVELSLSLRLICEDKIKRLMRSQRHHRRKSCVGLTYPADVLALRSGREGLGADDGVAPHEGVLLADVRAPLFGPNHGAVMQRRQAVHARLLVHL